MFDKVKEYFEFTEHNTTLKTEVLAGISVFLSMAYIFVVNPAILAEAGMDKSVVFFATIVVSSLATIIMGLWAKKPFSLAPGLEMNAYVAYVVVGTLGFVRQDALGAVFWSGVIMLIMNFLRIREQIIKAIPDSLKSGLAASVGVFLILIACNVSGVLSYEGIDLQGIGQLFSSEAIVLYVGLASALFLSYFSVKGGVLFSIIAASIVAHVLGIGEAVEVVSLSKDMLQGIGELNIGIIADSKIISIIVVLFIIDFYGSIAKFIGLTRNTTIVNKDGSMPQIQEALSVDGGATVIGACLGTTNVTTYVESAVGIGEGGRTGFTAVVTGVLMLFFLVLTPLVNLVPVVATTGALFFVGISLFPKRRELTGFGWIELVSIVLMVLATVATFGLDRAMLVGFGIFLVLNIVTGNWKRVNPYLVGSTLLLLLAVFL